MENIDINKMIDTFEKFFNTNNKAFFSYAWRNNIFNMLESEHKYEKLLMFMNEEMVMYINLINVFNPADRNKDYSNEMFKTYLDALQNYALLLNLRTIILDDFCTVEMRENVEYTIRKTFGVKYSEFLEKYIKKVTHSS